MRNNYAHSDATQTAVFLFGAGGHATVVASIIAAEKKYHFAGCVVSAGRETDCHPSLKEVLLGIDAEIPILVDTHALRGCIVAVGETFHRSTLVTELQKLHPGLPFVNAVHPAATVDEGAIVGAGSVIMAGAVVNAVFSH